MKLSRLAFMASGPMLIWAVASAAQVVSVDSLAARPGDQRALTVRFAAEGTASVGIQFDIVLNEAVTVRTATDQQPQCRLYPNIRRGMTTFAFVPADCSPYIPGNCGAVRALIFDFFERDPLPDGPLVECVLVVPARTAEGRYPIAIRNLVIATATGTVLPNARSMDGILEVRLDLATPTSAPTPTALPSLTPTPVPLCVGDCDNDGNVTIEEIIYMVLQALGEKPIECVAVDPNADGQVTIEELVEAVGFALHGCIAIAGARGGVR